MLFPDQRLILAQFKLVLYHKPVLYLSPRAAGANQIFKKSLKIRAPKARAIFYKEKSLKKQQQQINTITKFTVFFLIHSEIPCIIPKRLISSDLPELKEAF